MGSKSHWPTMEVTSQTLDEFGVPHETKIVSAHRTPVLLCEFAKTAESRGIGVSPVPVEVKGNIIKG